MAQFEVEAFTLLALAIVAIALRVVARCVIAGPKNFQLDDYMMPLAGVRSLLSLPFGFSLSRSFDANRLHLRWFMGSKPAPHTASAHGGWVWPTMP